MRVLVAGRIFFLMRKIPLRKFPKEATESPFFVRARVQRLFQSPLNMDQVFIDLIKESDIPSVVTLINDSYRYEATFKKDPTRIREPAFREMINSGTGRHYVASISPSHPFYEEFPSLPVDGIIGHI